MVRPIPRKRLPNTVTHKYNFTNNGESRVVDFTRVIKYVKVEEHKVLKKSREGKEIVGNAMLFYDYVTSKPSGISFKNRDLIVFNGKTYEIVDIDCLRADTNEPHHYEIMLK